MNCLSGICCPFPPFQQFQQARQSQQQALQAEQDKALVTQINELQLKLEGLQTQLEEEKRKRSELEELTSLAKRQSEDLQELVVRAKSKKQTASTSFRNQLSSCVEGLCSSREKEKNEMEFHLKQLQEDLAAAQAATDKLEAQRAQLEARAELLSVVSEQQNNVKSIYPEAGTADEETAPEWEVSPLWMCPVMSATHEALAPSQIPCGRNISFFRTRTPAQQREMKTRIKELLQDLQSVEQEIAQEHTLQKEVEFEALHHEATTTAIELELRSLRRIDAGLDLKLKQFAQCEDGQSKMLMRDVKRFFRGQTPAKQRELKDQILAFSYDLEASEAQATNAHRDHDKLHRKLSTTVNRKSSQELNYASNNLFAFSPR